MRRPPALAVFSASVALAVGATTGFVTLDKTVEVSVDGDQRIVHGLARSVGDVLDAGRVAVGPYDLVTPPVGAAVTEDTRITVRRGRPLALRPEDRSSLMWTVEDTVGGALDSLSVRTDGAYLSASRSAAVPLEEMALVVRRPHRVSILADGHVHPLVTIVPTVPEAFHGAKVVVARTDRVSTALAAYPIDGMVISVTRIRGGQQRVSEVLPFPTVRRADASLARGQTVVARPGTPGVRVSVFDLRSVNRRLVARRPVSRQVIAVPQPRVVLVGTRPVPTLEPHWRPGDSGGLDWGALARCESGGNPRSISASGTYQGLYQFGFGTWRGVGGMGDPAAAPPAEQTYRAQRICARAGRSPWPMCGRYL